MARTRVGFIGSRAAYAPMEDKLPMPVFDYPEVTSVTFTGVPVNTVTPTPVFVTSVTPP